MSDAAMFDDLRDLYQSVIIDHSQHPRHGHRLDGFDARARGDNPMCGDRVEVWLRYGPDETIAAAGFEARGCAISIASADLMAGAVQGRAIADARSVFAAFRDMVRTGECPSCGDRLDPVVERLHPLSGVHEYPSRVKCATLPWHALMAALEGSREASSE